MSYRERPQTCPACGHELDTALVPQPDGEPAAIERCPRCGGAYFDWFDGDPQVLSRALGSTGGGGRELPPDATCPKCQAPFAADPVTGGARCTGCTGLFLTAIALATLRVEHEHEAEPAGWLARLARLLGWQT